MKISLFLGIWAFILVFSFSISHNFESSFIDNYEVLFLKITYPVLLFLIGSVIFKYVKRLTLPLLLITSFTCLYLVGQEYSYLFYLLPLYLIMYLCGYFSAGWYAKNIQAESYISEPSPKDL
jgi:hypothetical protein